jgi:hypothetical protein
VCCFICMYGHLSLKISTKHLQHLLFHSVFWG